MEEKDRQELEDLLIEARKVEVKTIRSRINAQLLLFIGILAIANISMFPYDFERDNPEDPDGFFVGIVLQFLFVPVASLGTSLLISVFRFASWSYWNRFSRAFLVLSLILSCALCLVLILSLLKII